MKNVKLLAVIVCIVAVFDFAVLFADIFIDEKQSETACESGDFLSVLINSNTNLKTDCYVLENWGKEENYTPINEAEKILSATEYTRINRFESSIVKLFQNRKNSIIEIWLNEIDGKTYYDVSFNEWIADAEGAARSASVIKLFGNYYLCEDIVEGDSVFDWGYASYKAKNPTAIAEIENLQGDNELYSRAVSYRIGFLNSTFVCVIFIAAEILVPFALIKRKNSKKDKAQKKKEMRNMNKNKKRKKRR